jgi:hypothetical protein
MLGACIENSKARIETGQQPREALIEVSPEATEASLAKIEVNEEEVEAIPNEEMNVDTIEALENQHGDLHLAISLRQRPRRRTQDSSESR